MTSILDLVYAHICALDEVEACRTLTRDANAVASDTRKSHRAMTKEERARVRLAQTNAKATADALRAWLVAHYATSSAHEVVKKSIKAPRNLDKGRK